MENLVIEKRSKKDTDFDNILWTIKVRSNDDTIHALTGIKIDGGLLVCTNGYRLHCYMPERNIQDGFYHVKSATKKMIILEKEEGVIYPDYERVFPRPDFQKSIDCNDKSLFVHTIYQNFTDETCSFNLDYLTDSYMEDCKIKISKAEGSKPLCLYDEENGRAALVMPTKRNQ